MTQLSFENLHLVEGIKSPAIYKEELIGNLLFEVSLHFKHYLTPNLGEWNDRLLTFFKTNSYLTQRQMEVMISIMDEFNLKKETLIRVLTPY